jgi:threonine dehydrogenase-like Zn-dependent dehydrogenase
VNPVEEDLAEIAREALDPCVNALVECSGQPRVLEDAFHMVGFAGKILLLAACLENININPALLLVREICFESSYGCDMEEFRHCIELVSAGKVDVNPIISRSVSQAELPGAFERLCGPNDDVKVVMEIP